jgi:hypothetical protein
MLTNQKRLNIGMYFLLIVNGPLQLTNIHYYYYHHHHHHLGKRIHEGDINTSRAFTAVTGTNEWNVNTYFHMEHNGLDTETKLKGIHGRVWERDFFGDDVMKGTYILFGFNFN